MKDPGAGGARRALFCARPLLSNPSVGALCPRGRGARPSLVLPRPRNLAGTGTGAAGRRLEVGVEREAGWLGWLGRRLCRSSRLTRGQGGASRGAEPSSGAACVLAGAPFSLIHLQATTRQRTLLPFCCPQPPHPVTLCRLGTFTLLQVEPLTSFITPPCQHQIGLAPSDPIHLALSFVPSHLFTSILSDQSTTRLHSTIKIQPRPSSSSPLRSLLPGTLSVPYTCLTQPQPQASMLLLLCCLYSCLLFVFTAALWPLFILPP